MAKIVLNDVGDLTSFTTAAAVINANSAAIETAMENTLSRDGTLPNTMGNSLDMNSNQIINLPAPATANSPIRLQDLSTFTGGGTISSIPAGGTTGQVLSKTSAVNFATTWSTNNPSQFVFEGDSLTNINNFGTWPTKLRSLNAFFSRGVSTCYATDGDTAAAIVAEYPTQGGSISLPGTEQYYFLWAGTNDISASASAATIYSNLSTIWAAARTSGYKVVAFTMKAYSGYTAPQQLVVLALNALILSNPALYDYVVRLDALFNNNNDASLFQADLLHLTAAGNTLVAQEVISTLLNVDPLYSTPSDALAGGLQVNGGMDVSQEFGTTAKAGIGAGVTYCVDEVTLHNSGTMVLTSQQVTDAPPGLTKSLKLTVTTAQASLGASDFSFVVLAPEGYRTARLAWGTNGAQPVSIGFWTKIHRIGTYSGSVSNNASNRSYPFSFTQNVADTWEWKTVTIPGDNLGAWTTDGTIGLLLAITLGTGVNLAGPANIWASSVLVGTTGTTNGVAATSDVFQITGVIILPGIRLPSSQKLPLILRSFDQELVLCQRWYEKSFEYATAPAQNVGSILGAAFFSQTGGASASQATAGFRFATRKRADPTMTFYNPSAANAQIRNVTGATDWTATTAVALGEAGFGITGTSPGGSAAGNQSAVHWVADARL